MADFFFSKDKLKLSFRIEKTWLSMKNLFIILVASYMTISFANCQYKDYHCASVIKDVQNKCIKNYECNVADSLLLKADYYTKNPPDERCLNHYEYFVMLSGFYESALDSRNCSNDQMIYALDRSIELMLKAGELKSKWLRKNGEGAQKLIYLYSIKSKVYFDLKDQQQYDIAIEQIKYWKQVYNGSVKQIDHTIPPNTTIYSKKDTLHTEPIGSPSIEKKFVSKHIVVVTPKSTINKKSEFQSLTDKHLTIQFDSNIQLIPSDNPSRYKYKLLFEENVQHRVTVTYPGYEEQFFEFISTQVPQYDTLFVIMYPVGTPLYYTKWDKRPFQPDSFTVSIFIKAGTHKEQFDEMIDDLGLVFVPYLGYRKKSGEPFDEKDDLILSTLRKQNMVNVAGYKLGKNTILTNQLRIVWVKKTETKTQEEQTQIDSLLQKYQLKQIKEDLYEAPIGIGFYLNTIVEELNQVPIVHISYPETYQLIEQH